MSVYDPYTFGAGFDLLSGPESVRYSVYTRPAEVADTFYNEYATPWNLVATVSGPDAANDEILDLRSKLSPGDLIYAVRRDQEERFRSNSNGWKPHSDFGTLFCVLGNGKSIRSLPMDTNNNRCIEDLWNGNILIDPIVGSNSEIKDCIDLFLRITNVFGFDSTKPGALAISGECYSRFAVKIINMLYGSLIAQRDWILEVCNTYGMQKCVSFVVSTVEEVRSRILAGDREGPAAFEYMDLISPQNQEIYFQLEQISTENSRSRTDQVSRFMALATTAVVVYALFRRRDISKSGSLLRCVYALSEEGNGTEYNRSSSWAWKKIHREVLMSSFPLSQLLLCKGLSLG